MKHLTFCVSIPFVCASLLVMAMTVAVSYPASAQTAPPAPKNLRVDISDGTTGQLVITWSQVTANYYNVLRSTSANGTYSPVANCSGTTFNPKPVPANTIICRDNDGGAGLITNPPTYYYYRVQACNSVSSCSGDAIVQAGLSSPPSNAPVNCNCNQVQIPPTPSTAPAPPLRLATHKVSPNATFAVYNSDGTDINEFAAYTNTSVASRGTLYVNLPGSGSLCGLSGPMYTAENLGFDTICVNYDNFTQQETICQANNFPGLPQQQWETAVANCFTNLSQSKLDFTGDCTQTLPNGMPNPNWLQANCGIDPSKVGSGDPTGVYYVNTPYDAVVSRVATMLLYLSCTTDNGGKNYDTANTKWENYLAPGTTCTTQNPTPYWSQIIMGGWSQGGNMSTFAATEQPIQRAINLSAPPQAALVGADNATDVMTPASYFSYFLSHPARLRNVYGFVSALDPHYDLPKLGNNHQPSVYQSVWTAMGFDAEWDLNPGCNPNTGSPKLCSSTTPPNPQPSINCSANASHNLVSYSAQSVGGGHADTPYIWHEDIFKFMLID